VEIRKIQSIMMSSLLVAGLAGCSNSSSTSQADNSPWKAKRDAETANATSSEFVEVSLDEAVQVDGMEQAPMVEEPGLESISDFTPEPMPFESLSAFEKLELEAATPEVVAIEPEPVEEVASITGADIMSASPTAYAVQVYAGRKLANVKRYISAHGLDNMQIVKTDRDGDVIYVLVGLYADRTSARQAVDDLEQSTGSRPWIRSVGGLQRIAVQ